MSRTPSIARIAALALLLLSVPARAFGIPARRVATSRPMRPWRILRGGGGAAVPTEDAASDGDGSATPASPESSAETASLAEPFADENDDGSVRSQRSQVPSNAAVLASAGRFYSTMLERRPVATKSATAGLIFVLSDFLAQSIEKSEGRDYDYVRTVTSGLVGLLYFGPAAHYWYEAIFRLLPGTSLGSTLAKAFWGQIVFGPSFTCVFFAASLLQSGTFTPSNWWAKIKSDLPGAWLAGVGYWPLVDLVSYSLVPIKWIPLFVNFMSLIWTVYLSIVSNRGSK